MRIYSIKQAGWARMESHFSSGIVIGSHSKLPWLQCVLASRSIEIKCFTVIHSFITVSRSFPSESGIPDLNLCFSLENHKTGSDWTILSPCNKDYSYRAETLTKLPRGSCPIHVLGLDTTPEAQRTEAKLILCLLLVLRNE